MRFKEILFVTLFLAVAGFGLYIVSTDDFMKKVERVEMITKSIISGVFKGTEEYFPKKAEISDAELKEINITKISEEIGEGLVAKDQDKIAQIEIRTEEALAISKEKIAEEAKLKHTKATAKEAKIVKLEDLPQKFKPLKKVLHEPFKMGACELCHVSSGAKPGKIIEKRVEDLCYKCHKVKYTNKFNHKPVKDGKCTDCHDPHQSNAKNLLKGKDTNDLCMKCHKIGNEKRIKKTVSMSGEYKHKPAEKSCTECHEAHSSGYKMLLKDEGKMNLCLDCHSKLEDHIDMKKWINSVRYKHGPINESKNRCLECHDPHSTNHKGILKKGQVKLCLSCHNKEIKSDEDGYLLLNIDKHLKENKYWHGPIKDEKKEGGCAACHNPHGSNYFSMLRKSYTTNFYMDPAKIKKDFICFKCHEVRKITEKYTEDDKVTKFRDGDVNLHFLHAGDKKGRSCRACHDEHASPYPHLIRKYTEFGGVKFPMRYVAGDSGGSCQPACHKKYEYDRIEQKNKYSEDVFKK